MSNFPGTTIWFSSDMDVSVHIYSYQPGAVDFPPHTHDEYNFIFCLSERLLFETRGRVWTLEPGDVLVVNPGEVHRGVYSDAQGSSGLTFHVPIRELKRFLQKMRMPLEMDDSQILFLEKIHNPTLLPMLAELVSEIQAGRPGCDFMTESLLVRILVHLFREALPTSIVPQAFELVRQLPSWQMIRALEYMNSRDKNGFSLSELCATVGSSSSRFIQLFKSSCQGMSPHAFYNRLVTSKAERLFLMTDFSVKEVSFELGFKNESHFCKVFRLNAGVTPGGFRTAVLERNSRIR